MSHGRREHQLTMSGRERATFGVTVTFEAENGRLLTLARAGKTFEALREVCSDAVAADPTFRVVRISSPTSIYADLQGRPHALPDSSVQKTEGAILRRAGIGAMLHPRLIGGSTPSQQLADMQNRAEKAAGSQ